MKCLTYCVSEQINLSNVEQYCKLHCQSFQCYRHWNALELYDPSTAQYCYIFKNGTVIGWNYNRNNIRKIFDLLKASSVVLLEAYVHDEFSYQEEQETKVWPHPYFNLDCIALESQDSEIKLAISYVLSM